jgi:hypothetical protein
VQRLENLRRWRNQSRGGRGNGGKKKERTHGDDVGVAHDSIGESERKHDLELERRDVPVHCDLLEGIKEAEVALSGHFRNCGDALVDHVERDVGEIVMFEQVVGRA